MSLTASQQSAITARGNILVVAGAGTGKTSTLVERCLSCLLDEKPPASLEEILMVTFTDAAAAEMRQRIRARLEEKRAGHADHLRWSEQLALFETAHIGTLHGFCFQLVRQHFYDLELDPQLAILAEEEAALLAEEILEKVFHGHYAGETPGRSDAVQQLIRTQARGADGPIRALVLKLHHYSQTLRDAEGWLAAQLEMFRSPEPAQWRAWLMRGVADWRTRWLPHLKNCPADNLKASECAAILGKMPANPSREQCAEVLSSIGVADGNWPNKKKTAWREPIEDFFDEAAFLCSLARSFAELDPLAQDWNWVRGHMTTLLELAREFTARFSDAKRELGAVDFHDLEQHALRLLIDPATKQPSATAREWQRKLRFVFVDEYQDINDAQDAILKALSREDAEANRFLVGDVKQSIYRFRLADPHIFQHYVDTWRGEAGRAIPLVDNFRSREGIIRFINGVFGSLMRREIGGVPYDDDARLRFGDSENRAVLSAGANASPCVELLLRLQGATETATPESEGESARAWKEMMNLEEAAKEARLVAMRLIELKGAAHSVWDEAGKKMRPVEWGDMAVLLRSPSGKAETYAREFARLGVPLQVARGGFYESMEINDLLSLLRLLDNPLQDLPALAVLRSPLVGMTLDELAAIRLTLPKTHFWTALRRFHETCAAQSGWEKVDRFLKHFAAWRKLARQASLSRCLAAVLDETNYAAWLRTQSRGEQRHANVQRLLALARQFDQFQRQGVFRFLKFVEAQQAAETEPQVAPVSGENSVALMSIHQSKGLEFPVVVVADLGKAFNLSDLAAEIILDSEFGLCPQVKPPHTGQRYPSLPYWLARQRQKQEMLGEELRLLYVAMTRARDLLLLSGSVSEKKFHKRWSEPTGLDTESLLAARSYLDWLAAWATEHASVLAKEDCDSGENSWWRWRIFGALDSRLADEPAKPASPNSGQGDVLDAAGWQQLRERLAWEYPHRPATQLAAKASVTQIRRQLNEELGDESAPVFRFQKKNQKFKIKSPPGAAKKLSAVEIGNAHHAFLQFAALEQTGSVEGLRGEARRLELELALTPEQAAHLDFGALAGFWRSDIGRDIRANAKNTHRELPFTARFSARDLPASMANGIGDDEFVVVQGAADLAVLLPKEIWLVDFKTDQMTLAELGEKKELYEPQLRLYATALSRIYRRPVSRAYLHFLALSESAELKLE